MSDLNLVQ